MNPAPLFEKLRLGPLELPNRILMGSMHTGLEDKRADYPKLAAYFRERAEGGAGLMVTGGIAPNIRGWLKPFGGKLSWRLEVAPHRQVTDAVHGAGGRIAMQILHAGRYGYHPFSVSSMGKKAPINPFTPHALSARQVQSTISDYVNCARLAREAGYDGVEVMGSEGYFINQFLVEHTNRRNDEWGGSFENRMRLPVEIVSRIREAVGRDFIIVYRLSILDLIPNGQSWDEVVRMAKAISSAGATILNSGIGWHEARIPTIATSVPRGAFTWVTGKLRRDLRAAGIEIPLCTTNRLNTPEVADAVLAAGDADMVSMARPLLADPDFVRKASQGLAAEINTCIACNQACLDHTFAGKISSCLVNPRACHETELVIEPVRRVKKIAVVGAGPAGLAASTTLAERGHSVTLFEADQRIGGQFNLAKKIPGKEEFEETLRYFQGRLVATGVDVRLGQRIGAESLIGSGFDEVILATGVIPRDPRISGQDHPKVCSYLDVLTGKRTVGARVAVVGAGGIGFDVAEFLVHDGPSITLDREAWLREWGVGNPAVARGGVAGVKPQPTPPAREVFLLQRKAGKPGAGLGKTTGWIHRTALKMKRVEMIGDVQYRHIDDAGLHILVGDVPRTLEVDTVVLCTGQEPLRALAAPLQQAGITVHLIGGADVAAELDAKRAIRQATELAARL